jgi:hypothetical protein
VSKEDIVKFQTSCKNCVFSIISCGVQIGCEFGRIEKYRKLNKLAEHDENPKHYTINTICNTCRDHDWAKKYKNPMEQVIEETKVRVHAFIVDKSEDSPDNIKERVNKSFESLLASSILPKVIHVVLQNPNLTNEVMDIYNDLKGRTGIKVLISATYDKSRELDMIDTIISLVEQPYYLLLISGNELEPDYLEKVNISINTDLNPVVMSDRLYLTGLHRSLNGNNPEVYKNDEGDTITVSSLREKIEILVSEQDSPSSVLGF